MLEQLYAWIRSVAYFMVFSAVLSHVIPGRSYRKYIRFFTGLLLVILLLTPVMKLLGMGQEFFAIYQGTAYEEELRQIEEAGAYLKDIGSSDGLPEEAEGPGTGASGAGESGAEKPGTGEPGAEERGDNRISVEEIRIGQ